MAKIEKPFSDAELKVYEQKMLRLHGVDSLNQITSAMLSSPLLPHQKNHKCFKSVYNFTKQDVEGGKASKERKQNLQSRF